jgi:hypothetical protein
LQTAGGLLERVRNDRSNVRNGTKDDQNVWN